MKDINKVKTFVKHKNKTFKRLYYTLFNGKTKQTTKRFYMLLALAGGGGGVSIFLGCTSERSNARDF